MRTRQWFRFQNAADQPTTVDIHILDLIGGWDDDWIARNWGYDMGVTARKFVEDLAALDVSIRTIRVHLNSPGGDVYGAVNIANALRDQIAKGRTVETIVDGLAASAASIVMMAGQTVRIADNGVVMVHNPWSIAIGNAAEMRKAAESLDVVRDQIVATYRWHSSLEPEALIALMDAETWMSASEALEHGFATEVVEGLQAAASLTPASVAKLTIPEKYRARVQSLLAPAPATPVAASAAEVLRECRAADCLELAEELVTANATLETVRARTAQAKTNKAAAQARASQIRSICATAKQPELADSYVRSNMTVDDVRAQLAVITAKLDRTELDGSLGANAGAGAAKPKAVLSASAVYAERNRPLAAKE